MSESNVERARRGFEAAAHGELEVISGMLDPDVKWHGGDPDAAGACHNRDQALEFMRRARGRGGVGELVDMIPAGDKVVVIMRPMADGRWRAGRAERQRHHLSGREGRGDGALPGSGRRLGRGRRRRQTRTLSTPGSAAWRR
jgi:ketosteroid isomerase-like protein